MGMTMVEKILARHAGVDSVRLGDIVVCDVDMAVQIDLSYLTDCCAMGIFSVTSIP